MMKPANPATAVDHKLPDPVSYAPIKDGPHAGTFAKVGAAVIRRIGRTDYKRFEEPAGSGRYVWRLRPALDLHKADVEWDMRSPFTRKTTSASNNQNNEQ